MLSDCITRFLLEVRRRSWGSNYYGAELQLLRIIVPHAERDRGQSGFQKIGIVVEEADEAVLWLEMLLDCEIVTQSKLADLLKQEQELTALFTASQRTARNR